MALNLDAETATDTTASLPMNMLTAPTIVDSPDATTRKWVSFILIALMAAIIMAAFSALFMVNGTTPSLPSRFSSADRMANAITAYDTAVASDANADADRLLRLLNIVFGPVVTLVSSVTGFYFGARTAKEGATGG